MADKLTLTRAWDSAWEISSPVHHLGSQREPNKDERDVAELMGELAQMRLPCAAVETIGALVLAAWQAGRASITNDVPARAESEQPVAIRYRDRHGRWRYLNFPFTKGWTFPALLGTPIPLYERPGAALPASALDT